MWLIISFTINYPSVIVMTLRANIMFSTIMMILINYQVTVSLPSPMLGSPSPQCEYGSDSCIRGPGYVCGGQYGSCDEGLSCSVYGYCEGCSFTTFSCWFSQTGYSILL